MKKDYKVIAYEKLLGLTAYYISADSAEEAENICRIGNVDDCERDIVESTWIETILIEEI